MFIRCQHDAFGYCKDQSLVEKVEYGYATLRGCSQKPSHCGCYMTATSELRPLGEKLTRYLKEAKEAAKKLAQQRKSSVSKSAI